MQSWCGSNFATWFSFYQQVQDIEFMQIEMKVIEGLKVGNDCLKSMHEVNLLSCQKHPFHIKQ